MDIPRHVGAARVVTAAALSAVLAGAAGCGAGQHSPRPHPDDTTGATRTSTPIPPPTPAPSPKAPLTRAQALAAITRYVKLNNQANGVALSGDTKKAKVLNAEIETDALQKQGISEYDQLKVMTAKGKEIIKMFYYTDSSVYIPREYPAGQTPYFYAVTHQGKYLTLLVFVKSWRRDLETRGGCVDGPGAPGRHDGPPGERHSRGPRGQRAGHAARSALRVGPGQLHHRRKTGRKEPGGSQGHQIRPGVDGEVRHWSPPDT
ncbi:hypothetical protein [Actinacidiphila sp. ITFR-21]|uniref:hypothetical protein n=1 Tax=Actinacidiphila sp. ITFR-21 TaxID=3075199 RepID=UPI002889D7D1|nr:hypothetical protein [Streptomyces sp. ITFR-21]WNI19943.1 hypothetical protein RLT57_30850 [Streptomyces sp. ITFR-21]